MATSLMQPGFTLVLILLIPLFTLGMFLMTSISRILFATTGVLLRRLIEDPELLGVTHVIVDEVHERSLQSDFLLIILRDLVRRRPSLRMAGRPVAPRAGVCRSLGAGAQGLGHVGLSLSGPVRALSWHALALPSLPCAVPCKNDLALPVYESHRPVGLPGGQR